MLIETPADPFLVRRQLDHRTLLLQLRRLDAAVRLRQAQALQAHLCLRQREFLACLVERISGLVAFHHGAKEDRLNLSGLLCKLFRPRNQNCVPVTVGRTVRAPGTPICPFTRTGMPVTVSVGAA